jgi:hypothetical protein
VNPRAIADPKRVLVVANETVATKVLRDAIAERTRGAPTEVLVVAPALNRRLRHWFSDDDGARRAAAERLVRCVAMLTRDGIRATGQIGDSDPLLALADALRRFDAHEIIVATHPAGRSNWLERDLVGRARAKLRRPVLHVVVDGAGGYIAREPAPLAA